MRPFSRCRVGPAANVRLRHAVHTNGRHDARVAAARLQSVLQRQGVHHGGQHAHVVGRRLVHARILQGELRPRGGYSPPPNTMAICTPSWAAQCVCSARWTTASMAIPRSPGWQKPSPEIFRITRFGGVGTTFVFAGSEVTGEAPEGRAESRVSTYWNDGRLGRFKRYLASVQWKNRTSFIPASFATWPTVLLSSLTKGCSARHCSA